jgi:hypothetical protein
MNDILTLGGEAAVYEADALLSFASSAEPDATCELETGLVYPTSEAGDFVVRRLYFPVEWESGISLSITPIVDGEELTQFRQIFNRAGAGRAEVMVPVNKRGGRIALRVSSGVPAGRFYIDATVQLALQPALTPKRGAA